jgi:hypothetical protein
MLKYGLHSRINVPQSSLQNKRRSSSVCAPDTGSISSRHRHFSDIKNPDALILEIPSPLSPSEVFSNSSMLGSPAAIVHHNNSYTNLPAIPELPGNNPILPSIMTEPSVNDVSSPLPIHDAKMTFPARCPPMMPSIPENLSGTGSQQEQVLSSVGHEVADEYNSTYLKGENL